MFESTLPTLIGMSQRAGGGAPYVWLCSTVMLCVVGKKAWGKKKLKEALSDIVTCSDVQ
jgi:hypothetical protein